MKLGKKVNLFIFLSYILFIVTTLAHANSDIYLQKGSHYSFSFPKGSKYVLTNKAVIRAKVVAKDKLFINGIGQGSSKLTILEPKNAPKSYTIIVSSTDLTTSMKSAMQSIKNLNLPFQKISRRTILLKQPIEKVNTYKALHSLIKELKGQIKFQGTLSQALVGLIVQEIYQYFFDHQISDISCEVDGINIYCQIDSSEKGIKSIVQKYENIYDIQFKRNQLKAYFEYYELKFKIIQAESTNTDQESLGIDRFQIGLNDFIKQNFSKLLDNKVLNFHHNDIQMSLLSEPKIKIVLDRKSEIKVGGEIPFWETTANGERTQKWKFFGIKVNSKVEKYGGKFLINHSFNFSTPPMSGMSQLSSGSSAAYIKLNQPVSLFEIKLDINNKSNKGISFIKNIPILNKIFSSNDDSISNKKIFAYVQLQKYQREY